MKPPTPPKPKHVPNVQPDQVYADAYEARMQIWRAEFDAYTKAVSVCGAHAVSYARWVFHDRSGARPDVVVFCCALPDQPGWHPSADESHPGPEERLGPPFQAFYLNNTAEPGGFTFRWEVRFSWISYGMPTMPVHPDELRRRAEARRSKELERQAEELAAYEAQLAEYRAWEKLNKTQPLPGFEDCE